MNYDGFHEMFLIMSIQLAKSARKRLTTGKGHFERRSKHSKKQEMINIYLCCVSDSWEGVFWAPRGQENFLLVRGTSEMFWANVQCARSIFNNVISIIFVNTYKIEEILDLRRASVFYRKLVTESICCADRSFHLGGKICLSEKEAKEKTTRSVLDDDSQ